MTEARRDSLTASTIRVAIPLIAAIYGLVLLSYVLGPLGDAIRTGEVPGGVGTLDIVIAISLVGAGGVTIVGGGSWRVASLAGTAGLAWLGPYMLLDPDASTVVRRIAIALATVWPVIVLHLVLAATSHRQIDPRRRSILIALYGLSGAIAILRAATYDPFYEPDCGQICNHLPALIEPPPGVRAALRQGVHLVDLGAGLALVAWCLRDLATRSPRWRDGWLLVGGLVVGSAIAGLTAITLVGRGSALDDASRLDDLEVLLMSSLTLGMVWISIGLVLATIRVLRTRLRLRQIADEIESAPPPGSLEATLAAALDDPTIRVGYWLADDRRFVAPDGGPFDVADGGPDHQTTAIDRGGSPVAIVAHRDGIDPGALRTIGPSMLVALDNERLRAASLAHLRALQESRTRIVEVGDAERTRVERDLHDGAQQGLLAVSFDVRLARLNAERRGDVDQARRLEDAERIGLEIVEELRRVARGVYPAILGQAGLTAALAALGDEASIPVEIRSELADRPPPQTESAAYQVAFSALTDAIHRGALEVTIRIRGDTNHIVLDMTDDGAIATEPAIRIVDRVGASGGHVSIARRPDGLGNVVTGVLPCG